jgi:hypothetical protein
LPSLPFADDSFGLALCSHFLFLYGEQLDLEFHIGSLVELLRVASEVRVFPLLELGGFRSRHLRPVIDALNRRDCRAEIVSVPYEFQKGGDEMLVARQAGAGA